MCVLSTKGVTRPMTIRAVLKGLSAPLQLPEQGAIQPPVLRPRIGGHIEFQDRGYRPSLSPEPPGLGRHNAAEVATAPVSVAVFGRVASGSRQRSELDQARGFPVAYQMLPRQRSANGVSKGRNRTAAGSFRVCHAPARVPSRAAISVAYGFGPVGGAVSAGCAVFACFSLTLGAPGAGSEIERRFDSWEAVCHTIPCPCRVITEGGRQSGG